MIKLAKAFIRKALRMIFKFVNWNLTTEFFYRKNNYLILKHDFNNTKLKIIVVPLNNQKKIDYSNIDV